MKIDKILIELFGILLVLSFLPFVNSADISSCQTISSSNVYNLNQSVSSTGTCFTINADNVILDCNNNEITFGTSGAAAYGVYVPTRTNVTIKNCKLTDGNFSNSSTGRRGITFNIGTNFSVIENCIVNTSSDRAVYFISSNNNIVRNNLFYSSYITFASTTSKNLTIFNNSIYHYAVSSNALYLQSTSDSNVTNNYVNSTGATGIMVSDSSNNIIHNNNVTILPGVGLYFYVTSENNTASSNNVTATYAVGFRNASKNNVVKDCRYLYGSIHDVYLLNIPNSTNNTLLNCSYDLSKEYIAASDGEVIRKWYYRANVTAINGTALDSANVSAWNSSGNLQFTVLTNSTGHISTQELIDYVNVGGNRSYYSPYTINATKSGYTTISKVYNVTFFENKLNDSIRENFLTYCKNLDVENGTYYLQGNISSANTCFSFTAKNVTLDCQGNRITYGTDGNNNTHGCLTTKNFTTIKNCEIFEGNVSGANKFGINFSSSEGLIYNNTIITNSNNSEAVHLFGLNNIVQLNNVTAYGATFGLGIYLYGSSGNTIFLNNITTSGTISHGLSIYLESNNNNVTSNIIRIASFISAAGIMINSPSPYFSSNNSFIKMNISGGAYPIWVYNGKANFSLRDSVLNRSSTVDVAFQNYLTNFDVNITNVTRFDGSNIKIFWGANGSSVGYEKTLNLGWWLDLIIKNNKGDAFSNANVSIFNNLGQLVYSGLTNSSGQIPKQSITEFLQTNISNITYYSNYTINVTSSDTGFDNISYSLNMSTNKNISLTANDLIFPWLGFVSPTPENNTGRIGSFLMNISIIEKYLSNIIYTWGGVNTTIQTKFSVLDDAILILNFDNMSEYGENETVIKDFSKNNFTLTTTTNSTWIEGKYGGAYRFNRTSNIATPAFSFQSADKVLTYSFWYNGTNSTNYNVFFGDGAQAACFSGGNFSYIYRTANLNSLTFQYCNGTNPKTLTTLSTFFLGYDNQWVHVVVSLDYNNKIFKYYRNGVYLGNVTVTENMIFNDANRIKYIGMYVAGASQSDRLNGSLDEFMIFNRSLTDDEVKFLYNSQVKRLPVGNLTKYSSNGTLSDSTFLLESYDKENYTLLINQSGLVISGRYNYSLTATDYASNSNSTELRFIRGNTAPYVNNLSTALTDLNDIDPGVNFTVTANVTDSDTNFNYSILQWFNGSSGWVNVSMENITVKSTYTVLNTSFVLPMVEGNISYRIVSYDLEGDSNASSNYTIQNFYDCSWDILPSSLDEVIGYFEDKTVGNVTILNTGDVNYSTGCIIKFNSSYSGFTNLAIWGESSNWATNNRGFQMLSSVVVPPQTNTTFIINASFPSTDSAFIETPAVLFVANVTDTVDQLSSKSISTTLITSPPNPLLYQEIVSAPSIVWLTPGVFNLSSYLRNLGGDGTDNNTAYNVSFNWTLPSDLSARIKTGNETLAYASLSNSSKEFNNLSLELTSSNVVSMPKGNLIVKIYSFGYQNVSGNLSLISNADNKTILEENATIQFLCYSEKDSICVTSCGVGVDPDCVAESVSGGGGGGGGGGASVGKQEKSEAQYELTRGKESEFNLEILNKYEGDIKNLKISVTGIDPSLIEIFPNEFLLLEPGKSINVTAKIIAPSYFVEGKYALQFLITGEMVGEKGVSYYSERRNVDLYIVDLSRTETNTLINDSLLMIEKMSEYNFILTDVNNLFESMNKSFNERKFSEVKNEYDKIKIIYDNAIESMNTINELTGNIFNAEKKGISVIETKKMLYIAEIAFNRGDYALTMERLKEAKLTYALETKGEFNLFYTVKNNPLESAGVLIGVMFLSFSSSLAFRYKIYKRKLKLLSEEEKLLLELMKVVQRETFEKNHFSMEEYEQAMFQYEGRLSTIVEEKISIETKLAHLLKIKGKEKALLEEKRRLIELVKKIQDDYLNKKKLETRIYENMIKSYSTKLAEVEEELTFIEAQEVLSKNKFFKRLFKFMRRKK